MSQAIAPAIDSAGAPTDAFASTRANYERFAFLLLRTGHVPGRALAHRDFRVLLFLLGQKPSHYATHHHTIAKACDSNTTSIRQSLGRLRAAGLVLWELIPPHHALPTGRFTRTNVNRYWVHLPRLAGLLEAPARPPATLPKSDASSGTEIRRRPLLGGVPRVGSPASSLLPRRSDSSPPIPPRFVAFAWRYRRHSADGGDEVSQVPGEPSRTCPALRPRRGRDENSARCQSNWIEQAAMTYGSAEEPSGQRRGRADLSRSRKLARVRDRVRNGVLSENSIGRAMRRPADSGPVRLRGVRGVGSRPCLVARAAAG
jgi:hypothetical protein